MAPAGSHRNLLLRSWRTALCLPLLSCSFSADSILSCFYPYQIPLFALLIHTDSTPSYLTFRGSSPPPPPPRDCVFMVSHLHDPLFWSSPQKKPSRFFFRREPFPPLHAQCAIVVFPFMSTPCVMGRSPFFSGRTVWTIDGFCISQRFFVTPSPLVMKTPPPPHNYATVLSTAHKTCFLCVQSLSLVWWVPPVGADFLACEILDLTFRVKCSCVPHQLIVLRSAETPNSPRQYAASLLIGYATPHSVRRRPSSTPFSIDASHNAYLNAHSRILLMSRYLR